VTLADPLADEIESSAVGDQVGAHAGWSDAPLGWEILDKKHTFGHILDITAVFGRGRNSYGTA
jgi:hypothetical protein